MPEHDRSHGHPAQRHAQHGAVVHGAPADAMDAYRQAFAAAQPDAGRAVVSIALDAREVDWAIAAGGTFKAWGFNGLVPGPTIAGRVGDVLEVRFTNHLAQATTIHWHGLRVPAAMDGTDMVQRPVGPGNRSPTASGSPTPARSGTTPTATNRSRWSAAFTGR